MTLQEWLRNLFPLPSDPKIVSSAPLASLMADMADTSPAVRRKAILALGERNESRAVDAIIKELDDPDDEVRLAAVVALGKIGDPRAVEPLILKLKSYDYF